jgi:hypothetical protein
VEDIHLPHPYCITPKHLKYADSMFLDKAAITRAEKKGAQCDICRKLCRKGKQTQILPFSQHEREKLLFIEVDDGSDLNKVKGLHEYLLEIKPLAMELGIGGFAFPPKGK